MTGSKKGMIMFIAAVALVAIIALFGWGAGAGLHSGPYLAVVNIVGTISEDDGATYNQEWLLQTIDELTNDSANRGILLYVDSPGGTVYESDEAYLALENYKAVTGRPVVAYMASTACSGAYYISCAADEIYANRNTLTGSIGVIMGSSIDLSGFLEEHGIKVTTIHAGKNKNMFNYDEPVTEEQAAIMQSIVDESYEQFTEIVAAGRGMDLEYVQKLADGRIYTARQAAENGLIDGIVDDIEEAAQILAALGGIDYAQTDLITYSYEAEESYLDRFLGMSGAQSRAWQKAELLIEAGPYYYTPGL